MKTLHYLLLIAVCLMASASGKAQVELVYHSGGETKLLTGVAQKRRGYLFGAEPVPLAPGGTWEIRAAAAYADTEAAVVPCFRLKTSAAIGSGPPQLEVQYDLAIRPEHDQQNLYYVAAWNVHGRDVKFDVKALLPIAQAGEDNRILGGFFINASDRNGFLRVYVLQQGRSLRGLAGKEATMMPLRAALDGGDFAQALAWLGGAGRDQKLPQPLLEQIVRSGNADLLAAALTGKNSRRFKGDDGAALIGAATETGQERCVELLLKLGADANTQGFTGVSALHRAVWSGSAETVRLLLEAGAKPSPYESALHESPLQDAIVAGDTAVATLLIEKGAKLPEKSLLEDQLCMAVARQDVKMAALLLKQGASLDTLIYDRPPLVIAAFGSDPSVVTFLLGAGAKVDQTGPKGETALMGAAWMGDDTQIQILRKAGASLAKTDKLNRTPASWAAMAGRDELALRLYRENPCQGAAATRLLHDAVVFRCDQLEAALLAANTHFDFRAEDIDKVLDEILRSGNLKALELACAQGLDVNRSIYGAWTLGGLARRYASAPMTEALGKCAPAGGLKVEVPTTTKLPVEIIQRAPGLSPTELGDKLDKGEAVVDFFIDAIGRPCAPITRSASTPEFGQAAMNNVLKWRFSPANSKSPVWRRAVLPFSYSAEAFGKDDVLMAADVDNVPLRKNKVPLSVDPREIRQAAWVSFRVSPTGQVFAPLVVSASKPGLDPSAFAAIRDWKYSPAIKDTAPVWCLLQGVALFPAGGFLEIGLTPLGATDDGTQPPMVTKGAAYRRDSIFVSGEERGFVVVRFVVNPQGTPESIVVVASSDPALNRRGVDTCAEMQFDPALHQGKPVAFPMLRTFLID